MGFRHGLVGSMLLGLAFTPVLAGVGSPVQQAEVTALRAAYLDLNQGDHDYKGHRIKALRHVEAACRLLGLQVSGDGKRHSAQNVSDGLLKDAQAQLESVRSAAAANKQAELQKLCDEALKQIQMALSIK